MEQLTKNQAVATSQEAVQNQNEPQLRDENAHNDKSVHGVLNPTYQAGLRRDAVQPDIEAERKKKIGRASCRERVWISGVGASLKHKQGPWRPRAGNLGKRLKQSTRTQAMHVLYCKATGTLG